MRRSLSDVVHTAPYTAVALSISRYRYLWWLQLRYCCTIADTQMSKIICLALLALAAAVPAAYAQSSAQANASVASGKSVLSR